MEKPHFQSRLRPQKPLISYVTNEWLRDPKYAKGDPPSPYDRSQFIFNDPPRGMAWLENLRMFPRRIPRKVQRDLALLFMMVFTTIFGYFWFLKPSWQEQKDLVSSYEPGKNDVFGVNLRPQFSNMVHMKKLDSSLLPTSSEGIQRLVFVGDVHGCKEELVQLLHKVDFQSSSDHLILTGDMVNKGPDTPGTVELVQSLHASCVRGNHEDRLLLAHAASVTHERHEADEHLAKESPHGDAEERALAKKLTKGQLKWLAECPVILHVGPLPGLNDVVVAHAGLVPGVPLARQDPFGAMNMRAIEPHTRSPSPDRNEGLPWWKVWNHHQRYEAEPDDRQTVVYGHDARTGVHLKHFSYGIDGGCVYGGTLNALVVEHEPPGWFAGAAQKKMRTRLVSVKCQVYKQKSAMPKPDED